MRPHAKSLLMFPHSPSRLPVSVPATDPCIIKERRPGGARAGLLCNPSRVIG